MLEYSVSQTVLWSAAYENSNLTHITYDVHDVGVIKKCMQCHGQACAQIVRWI